MRKFLILALLLLPGSLFAQYDRHRDYSRNRDSSSIEITPFVGYRYSGTITRDVTSVFSEDVDIANNGNFGLAIDIPVAYSGIQLELLADRQMSHLTTGSGSLFGTTPNIADINTTYYHGGLLIPFSQTRTTEPFVAFGAGITNIKAILPGIASDNRFSANAAVGVKLRLNRNIALRIEERGFWTGLNNNNNDFCSACSALDRSNDLIQGETNVGLSFRF